MGGAEGGFHGAVVVRGRDEAGFVRRRGQVNTRVEHGMEEALEACHIAPLHVREGSNARLVREVQAEHARYLRGHEGHAGGLRFRLQSGTELRRQRLQARMEAGGAYAFQRGEAGGHGHRVTAKGARLVHGAQWREAFHNLAAATEGAYWHAATNHLAERGEVRSDAEELLRTAAGYPKAGHHFVENKHGTMARAFFAQRF